MTLDNATSLMPRLSDQQREQITNDLLLLASLHQNPIDRETVVGLWQRCYDGLLQLRHNDVTLRRALNGFCQALTDIPTCFDVATEALFQGDFARLCKAIMTDSGSTEIDAVRQDRDRNVSWQSVDHWMKRHGKSADRTLKVEPNPLTAELRHVAFFVAADGVAAPPGRIVELLGCHYHETLERVAIDCETECQTQTYRSLAKLTAAYIRSLTDLLDARAAQSVRLPIAHLQRSDHRQEIHHA